MLLSVSPSLPASLWADPVPKNGRCPSSAVFGWNQFAASEEGSVCGGWVRRADVLYGSDLLLSGAGTWSWWVSYVAVSLATHVASWLQWEDHLVLLWLSWPQVLLLLRQWMPRPPGRVGPTRSGLSSSHGAWPSPVLHILRDGCSGY